MKFNNKRKVIVIGGCGSQGEKTVRSLYQNKIFSEIIIADKNLKRAEIFANELDKKIVKALAIDIGKYDDLVNLMKRASVIINAAGPYSKYGIDSVKAAIESKSDYIDINDDAEITEKIFRSEKFDILAKEAGITVIIGLGTSPGLTNILAKEGARNIEIVDKIEISSLSTPKTHGKAVWAHRFNAFMGESIIYRSRNWERIPSLSEMEKIKFLDILKPIKCYVFSSPEPVTIPNFIKNVQDVKINISYQPNWIMEFMSFVIKYGLTQDNSIIINGFELKPFEFMVSYLSSKISNDYLNFDNSTPIFRKQISIIGKNSGRKAHIIYCCKYQDSTRITGTLPAIAAELLIQRKIEKKGLLAPEALDPQFFLKETDRIGVSIECKSNKR